MAIARNFHKRIGEEVRVITIAFVFEPDTSVFLGLWQELTSCSGACTKDQHVHVRWMKLDRYDIAELDREVSNMSLEVLFARDACKSGDWDAIDHPQGVIEANSRQASPRWMLGTRLSDSPQIRSNMGHVDTSSYESTRELRCDEGTFLHLRTDPLLLDLCPPQSLQHFLA